MKNLIIGFALVACFAACKSSHNTSVTDPNGANMPKAECKGSCEGMKECSGQKAECTGQKAECCKDKKPQG